LIEKVQIHGSEIRNFLQLCAAFKNGDRSGHCEPEILRHPASPILIYEHNRSFNPEAR